MGCIEEDVPSAECVELPKHRLREMYEKSIRKNEGRLIVSGIFARANKSNTNARLYPKVSSAHASWKDCSY